MVHRRSNSAWPVITFVKHASHRQPRSKKSMLTRLDMPLVPESYWSCAADTCWGGHPALNPGLLRQQVATDHRRHWWIPQNSSWNHQHEQLRQWCPPRRSRGSSTPAGLRSSLNQADSAVRPAAAMSGNGWISVTLGTPNGHLIIGGRDHLSVSPSSRTTGSRLIFGAVILPLIGTFPGSLRFCHLSSELGRVSPILQSLSDDLGSAVARTSESFPHDRSSNRRPPLPVSFETTRAGQ